MNTDIRLQVTLLSHPKTIKLRRRLGDGAFIALIQLWIFVAQNKPSGQLTGMDVDDIEIAAGWTGEEGALVSELLTLRLLDETDDGYSVHDWQDNNPWCCKSDERSDQARKAINTRWEKVRSKKAETSKDNTECIDDKYSNNQDVILNDTNSNTECIDEKYSNNQDVILNDTNSNTECIDEKYSFPFLSSPILTLPNQRQEPQCAGAREGKPRPDPFGLVLSEKRQFLLDRFPGVDIELIKEKLCHRYRDEPVIDPWALALAFIEREAAAAKSRNLPARHGPPGKSRSRIESSFEATASRFLDRHEGV